MGVSRRRSMFMCRLALDLAVSSMHNRASTFGALFCTLQLTKREDHIRSRRILGQFIIVVVSYMSSMGGCLSYHPDLHHGSTNDM